MKEVSVFIRIEKEGKMPTYESVHAAGCDVYATKDMVLRPGETKVMPLDFIIALEPGIEAQIRPRSGLSLKTDLRVANSPGTIDSDYRNIVGVILHNSYNIANLPYEIAANPKLLEILKTEYKEMALSDYLASKHGLSFPGNSVVLQQSVLIDKKGNPYGTIYIKKGERIAQMVFAEYRKAKFIPHPSPETIGEDRGGGFGSTGV